MYGLLKEASGCLTFAVQGNHMMTTLQMILLRAKMILDREDGQDLIEYALLVALISLGAVASLSTLGKDVYNTFFHIHVYLYFYFNGGKP